MMIKIVTSFVAGFIFSSFAVADVYKYTAPDGSVYYTDSPPNQDYTRIIRTKVIVRVRKTGLLVSEVGNSGRRRLEISDGRRSLKYANYASFKAKPFFPSVVSSATALANREKYKKLITQAALDYGVDEKLLHAVIQAESAYNPDAVSPAGAVGLMQLMPDTALRYGVKVEDRTDPAESIKGGARYLRDLLKMFDSNLSLAVAGYNAGENAVKKYNNSIPPYPETQNYVAQVLAFYQR